MIRLLKYKSLSVIGKAFFMPGNDNNIVTSSSSDKGGTYREVLVKITSSRYASLRYALELTNRFVTEYNRSVIVGIFMPFSFENLLIEFLKQRRFYKYFREQIKTLSYK